MEKVFGDGPIEVQRGRYLATALYHVGYDGIASRCDLAFVRGDENYRRLLGDRQWDHTTPLSDMVGF